MVPKCKNFGNWFTKIWKFKFWFRDEFVEFGKLFCNNFHFWQLYLESKVIFFSKYLSIHSQGMTKYCWVYNATPLPVSKQLCTIAYLQSGYFQIPISRMIFKDWKTNLDIKASVMWQPLGSDNKLLNFSASVLSKELTNLMGLLKCRISWTNKVPCKLIFLEFSGSEFVGAIFDKFSKNLFWWFSSKHFKVFIRATRKWACFAPNFLQVWPIAKITPELFDAKISSRLASNSSSNISSNVSLLGQFKSNFWTLKMKKRWKVCKFSEQHYIWRF